MPQAQAAGLYSAQRARRALFHTIIFRVLSQGATALGYIVLVRGLSEQSLGVFSLLYSVIPLIGTVASLGLDQALKRYQPEYLRTHNLAGAAWLVRLVSLARLVSNVVLLGLLFLAWNWLAPRFHLSGHRADFGLFILVVLLYFQTAILQSALAAHMLQRFSVGSLTALAVVKTLAYLALREMGMFNLQTAIISDTIAYAVCYLVLFVAYRRECRLAPADRHYKSDPEERKRLGRYALANNFNDAGSLLLYVQTDNFFIAALMSQVAVGTYAFYVRLNEMVSSWTPVRVFENVVQPLFFSIKQEEATERLPRYFTLLIDINMALQWPLVVYTALYNREIVSVLFAGKFIEYASLLPIVVGFAVVTTVFAVPITMVAQYQEKATLILRSQLFGLYQIAAMLVLVPLAGLYGAAIATGTLHLGRNAYVWWNVRDSARWKNAAAVLSIGTVAWGTATALCLAAKMFVPSAWGNLLCGGMICAATGLLYLRSPAIALSDRQILANVLHGRESALLRWIGILPRTS